MRVLVTDGNQRSTLGVVRALGQAGIPVIVGESEAESLAGRSRYCTGTILYPSPITHPRSFCESLHQSTLQGGFGLLLPMTDISMLLVAEGRDSGSINTVVPFPHRQKVLAAQDKGQVLERARNCGIPCPETYTPCDLQELKRLPPKLHYPLVVKPRFSRYLCKDQWVSGSIQYARDFPDLIAKWEQIDALIPQPLIQERLEGEGKGVFLLVWEGELKAAFCHRRLREKPPWGGVSTYCESIPLDQTLVDMSFDLLKALDWQGVAMVEFKLDSRDGQAKLMEVNGRFWGSLQLAIDAGVNFPLTLYRLATGENPPAQFEYKSGIRSRWLLGDLDHLLIRLLHRRSPYGTEYSLRSNLRTALDFLNFFDRDVQFDVFRLQDPWPGWFEIRKYLRENMKGLISRRGRTGAH